jgi:hypothetical protein
LGGAVSGAKLHGANMAGAHDFEIYTMLVEDARDTRRARRELTALFITLNTGGLGAIAIAGDPGRLAVYLIGLMVLCLLWSISNGYFITLLAVKYQALYRREEDLGISVLRDEWNAIVGRRPQFQFFSLERRLPNLFLLGYLIFLAFQVSWADIAALAQAAWAPAAQFFNR